MLKFEREDVLHTAQIKVIGVGGGGSNAVDHMVSLGMNGVQFSVVNTDVQALSQARVAEKLQIGVKLTQGMGAGANPEIGRQAALEDTEALNEALEGVDMLFLIAGFGGGTGTGATPVIAKLAKEKGIITIAVVTKPFIFEGKNRANKAEDGLNVLEETADAVICISNNKLFEMTNEDTSLIEAFNVIDGILCDSVYSIFRLVTKPGLINVDFADIKNVMDMGGSAVLTFGEGVGNDKAIRAVKAALNNPLLEGKGIRGARGVLISIIGGADLSLFEVNNSINLLKEESDVDANVIFGVSIEKEMENKAFVTIIATGISSHFVREHFKPQKVEQTVIDFANQTLEPNRFSAGAIENLEMEDLDVPTFLRRKRM